MRLLLLFLLIPFTVHAGTLEEINSFRIKSKLAPIVHSQEVCKFTKIRINDIPKEWSHRLFFKRSKINGDWTENLGKDFNTDKEVVHAWMKSKTHRSVILDKKTTNGCVAKVKKGNVIYWVFNGWNKN